MIKLFIPNINEVSKILINSHSSKGGSTLLYRNNKVWNNVSALSILNAWDGGILQKVLMEVCAGGDGGKMGCFITLSILKSFIKEYDKAHPHLTTQVKKDSINIYPQIKRFEASESTLFEIGKQSQLDEETIQKVSEALYLSGSLGSHISLEKGDGVNTEVIQSESFFATVKSHIEKEINLKGPLFALFNRPLMEVSDVQQVLETASRFEGRPLIILAPLICGKALNTIKLNTHKKVIESYAVETPRVSWASGWLDDVSSFVGATVYNSKFDKEFKSEFLGSALDTTLTHNDIIINPYDDHAETTADRVEYLLSEADSIPYPHTQDLWRKRANALSGSLVRLKVGSVSESEARWKRVLTEKALLSMSDAIKNGFVEGAIPALYNIKTGNHIIDRALRAPFKIVCLNLGKAINDPSVWDIEELYEPFPAGRLQTILEKAISASITLGSIGHIITK